ncbi:sortase family protein [Lentilactobacillus senioris DSM 24302 = JCM 17472]|uniref:Sortase family protein n=1 Tax=Lentilactobacillus senioris DSM 24302 = JCM 17472 TaxID=1423802 RepID=A0A0R2CSJ3_9LACO|nr:class A sortase [Lentilactobacillus senioris]KRM94751.1 sortase family protein [Lentilactobacillus senioris DSM 24302 = JCM 17472]
MAQKSKIKTVLKASLIAIITIVALLLIFNRQVSYWLIKSYQPEITRDKVAKAQPKKADYNFSKVKSLGVQQVVKARSQPNKVQIAGQILIPQIGLHLPIELGVSNDTLALAAGTMRADQKMGTGNYPLAGHHMVDSNILFGPLYTKAQAGQLIYLTNMKTVYEYRIYKRQFIAATDVDVINQTQRPIITLITCDATGAGRLMIRGRYLKSYSLNQAEPKIKRALNGPVNS